jgi:hypothetical protein
MADWNWGELGLTPLLPVINSWPCAFGSGKLGTPWERMQLANLMTAWVFDPLDDPFPVPLPAGRSFRHVCIADWNCGEFVSMPEGMAISRRPFLSEMAESGKFGTPFALMHPPKAIPLWLADDGWALVPLDDAGSLPPLQAATSTPAVTNTAASLRIGNRRLAVPRLFVGGSVVVVMLKSPLRRPTRTGIQNRR